MAPLTCIANLNMAISEERILNTEVSWIKIHQKLVNKGKRPNNSFMSLLKQFQQTAIQLDSAKMLAQ